MFKSRSATNIFQRIAARQQGTPILPNRRSARQFPASGNDPDPGRATTAPGRRCERQELQTSPPVRSGNIPPRRMSPEQDRTSRGCGEIRQTHQIQDLASNRVGSTPSSRTIKCPSPGPSARVPQRSGLIFPPPGTMVPPGDRPPERAAGTYAVSPFSWSERMKVVSTLVLEGSQDTCIVRRVSNLEGWLGIDGRAEDDPIRKAFRRIAATTPLWPT